MNGRSAAVNLPNIKPWRYRIVIYVAGSHTYQVQEDWGQLPEDWSFGWIPLLVWTHKTGFMSAAEANTLWSFSIAKATFSRHGLTTS